MNDEPSVIVPLATWNKLQHVIEAAVAYCEGTNRDDHPLDQELRLAVGELTRDA